MVFIHEQRLFVLRVLVYTHSVQAGIAPHPSGNFLWADPKQAPCFCIFTSCHCVGTAKSQRGKRNLHLDSSSHIKHGAVLWWCCPCPVVQIIGWAQFLPKNWVNFCQFVFLQNFTVWSSAVSPHPWRFLKDTERWPLGTGVSGERGSAGGMVDLLILEGFSNRNHSVIPWLMISNRTSALSLNTQHGAHKTL